MPAFIVLLLLTFSIWQTGDTNLLQLENGNTEICYTGSKYVLTQNRVNSREYYWNKSTLSALYLVNLANGIRIKIAENNNDLLVHGALSPEEQFASWYDVSIRQYRTYEITTGITRSLPPKILSIANWMRQDTALICYSQYDIYRINSRNLSKVNLTNNYGSKHKIIFRILSDSLLIAFNTINKQNGFWAMSNGDPFKYTMDDCLYYFPTYPLNQFKPIKQNGTWLLQKQTAQSPPNLFTTKDFKTFTPVTVILPAYQINARLIHFKRTSGILYTPANFDSSKKYPIIFTYYGSYSDNLYRHLPLQLSEGTLNIPTYINKDYIIFVPDVKTKKGHPGSSTARSVIRAAKHLSKYSYIDQQRMGLQGFSFGGYITNYIITHSHLFAAAQESSGPTDFISGYGSIRKLSGAAYQPLYERGQNNIGEGVTPWHNTRRYVKNSPIFRVHHITTPLLMLHNENDNQVPWSQAAELFTALRRLQKPVWWIQYPNEGHQLTDLQHQEDFTLRQMDFFDYYLKHTLPPFWMDTLLTP